MSNYIQIPINEINKHIFSLFPELRAWLHSTPRLEMASQYCTAVLSTLLIHEEVKTFERRVFNGLHSYSSFELGFQTLTPNVLPTLLHSFLML
jgi:hypothetical protein